MKIQMDVDEFRNILLERLEKLTLKPSNQTKSFVKKIFYGR